MSDKIDQGALADAIRLGVAEYERLREIKIEQAKRPPLPEQREYRRNGKLYLLTNDAGYRQPKQGEVYYDDDLVLTAVNDHSPLAGKVYILTLIDPPKPTQELLDEGELDIDGDYPVKPNVGDIFVDYRGRHKCRSCRPETLKPFHHGYRWLLKKREPKLRYARDGCDIRDAVSDDCIANVWDTNCAQHVVDALNAYDQGCKQ